MSITKQTVARVAHLARIKVAENRLSSLAGELDAIVAWVEQLGDVDTDDVDPMSSAVEMRAIWRDDSVTDGGYPERVMKNAPEPRGDFYTVPRVVE